MNHKKYDFTPQLQRVFKALRNMKKSNAYRSCYTMATNDREAQILRKAYLTSLQGDLMLLYSALEDWIDAGARMEESDDGLY